jgi:hypothetical protein
MGAIPGAHISEEPVDDERDRVDIIEARSRSSVLQPPLHCQIRTHLSFQVVAALGRAQRGMQNIHESFAETRLDGVTTRTPLFCRRA